MGPVRTLVRKLMYRTMRLNRLGPVCCFGGTGGCGGDSDASTDAAAMSKRPIFNQGVVVEIMAVVDVLERLAG